jgi:hypothetical protein
MTSVAQPTCVGAHADAGASAVTSQLPMRKRKKSDDDSASGATSDASEKGDAKVLKFSPASKESESELDDKLPVKRAPMSKARGIRLEQNRKAARESRRRKKVMIEELQRSVIFFSRANGTLKQQNDDLSRMLLQAQAQVAQIESQQPQTTNNSQPALAQAPRAQVKTEGEQQQQQLAETVATQAIYESQGFPSVAARQAAKTMNPGSTAAASAPAPPAAAPGAPQALPAMQPGATMQAMANFQQAAAAAMQAAVQGMQGIPGVSMASLAATPAGANPQQAYTDAMTALAMQQAAAAAAAGQQFFHGGPFMSHPMMAWTSAQANMEAPGAIQQTAPAPAAQQPAQPSA